MVVGQIVAGETMMLAEISTISGAKTGIEDDATAANAEALALEALRLAEEAKKAAQRLAEVRATLNYLKQLNSPKEESLKVQTTIVVEEKKEAEVVDEKPPVETELEKEVAAPLEASTATPVVAEAAAPVAVTPIDTVSSPSNSMATPTSPVSILKNPASKSEPKEVRYAPDTVDPVSSPSRKGQSVVTEAVAEEDLIVKLYDAVGIDKICGLDFSAPTGEKNWSATAKPSSPLSPKKTLDLLVDPFAGAKLNLEKDTKVVVVEQKKEESTDVTSQADREPAVEPVGPHDEVTPAVAETAPVEEPATPTEEVVEEATEELVTKVDPPTSTSEDLKAEESSSSPAEPVEAVPADEATSPVKAAEPKGAKNLTVDTTATAKPSSLESPHKMTPLMKKALARQRSPVLAKPDPFGGEHDDMDFIPCGSSDVVVADDGEEEAAANQLSSPRMLCGWGV